MTSCIFCRRVERAIGVVGRNDLAVALSDAYALNPGHTLVLPLRHEADYLALSTEEQSAMHSLAVTLAQPHRTHGVNLGLNVGAGAGQTVPHAHMHMIPRVPGDVPDPRGGVRWVIPQRAAYWGTA